MRKSETNDATWQEELNAAPNLKLLDGHHPFTAPDGYFDQLPSLVQDKIAAQQKQPRWLLWMQLFRKPVLIPIAVVLIIITLVGINKWNDVNKQQGQVAMNYDDIYSSGLVDLDESLLIESLAERITLEDNNSALEDYLIETSSEEILWSEL